MAGGHFGFSILVLFRLPTSVDDLQTETSRETSPQSAQELESRDFWFVEILQFGYRVVFFFLRNKERNGGHLVFISFADSKIEDEEASEICW